MMPYYGSTLDARKPLLPQLRAAVLAYTDRWGMAPSAIYLRDPAGLAAVGAVPVLAVALMPRDVCGLSLPGLPAQAPAAVGYQQEVLL